MRTGGRFVVASLVLGCVGAAFAACSSDNTSSGGGDSGVETGGGGDGTTGEAAPPEAGKEAAVAEAGGGGDAGGADAGCQPIDASIATVDAGALWGCYESACASELSGCASDCTCNDAFLLAIACTAQGGSANTCFNNAIMQNLSDSHVILVSNCLLNQGMAACMADAGPASDGGVDAPTDGASRDGSSGEGSVDAAAEGGSDAAGEASLDGGTSDSPSSG